MDLYLVFTKESDIRDAHYSYQSALDDVSENCLNDVTKVLRVNEEDGTCRNISEDIARDYWKLNESKYDGSWDGEHRVIPYWIVKELNIDEDDYRERHERSKYQEHNTLNKAHQGV